MIVRDDGTVVLSATPGMYYMPGGLVGAMNDAYWAGRSSAAPAPANPYIPLLQQAIQAMFGAAQASQGGAPASQGGAQASTPRSGAQAAPQSGAQTPPATTPQAASELFEETMGDVPEAPWMPDLTTAGMAASSAAGYGLARAIQQALLRRSLPRFMDPSALTYPLGEGIPTPAGTSAAAETLALPPTRTRAAVSATEPLALPPTRIRMVPPASETLGLPPASTRIEEAVRQAMMPPSQAPAPRATRTSQLSLPPAQVRAQDVLRTRQMPEYVAENTVGSFWDKYNDELLAWRQNRGLTPATQGEQLALPPAESQASQVKPQTPTSTTRQSPNPLTRQKANVRAGRSWLRGGAGGNALLGASILAAIAAATNPNLVQAATEQAPQLPLAPSTEQQSSFITDPVLGDLYRNITGVPSNLLNSIISGINDWSVLMQLANDQGGIMW